MNHLVYKMTIASVIIIFLYLTSSQEKLKYSFYNDEP